MTVVKMVRRKLDGKDEVQFILALVCFRYPTFIERSLCFGFWYLSQICKMIKLPNGRLWD
jgi:hypothetical protein